MLKNDSAINVYIINEKQELLLLQEKGSDLWLALSGLIKSDDVLETINVKTKKEVDLLVKDSIFIDESLVGEILMRRYLVHGYQGKVKLKGKYKDYKWVALTQVEDLDDVCPYVKLATLKILKIMTTIKKGIYQHYKGNEYKVIGEAKNTETKELEVIYQKNGQDDKNFSRSKSSFLEDVEVDGEKKARFQFIKESDEDSWEHKCKLALADYQNLLKKTAADKTEFAKYAISDILEDIIPVYDHLKLSLSSLPATEEKNPWVQGVEYVLKQFKEVLETRGVEEIKTVGEKFDHNTMEAIEGNGELVVKEVMPGYKLNGRLIKAAKVVVAEK